MKGLLLLIFFYNSCYGQNGYQLHYDSAVVNYNCYNLKKALIEISEAIKVNATDSAYILKAKCEIDMKKKVKDLSFAIKLNPNNSSAYAERGGIKSKEGDMKGALADYLNALRIRPLGRYYYGLAATKMRMQDYKNALIDYSIGIQMDTNNGEGYYYRACLFNNMKDYKSALLDYNRALQFNPNDAVILDGKAEVCFMLGDTINGCEAMKMAKMKGKTTRYYQIPAFCK
jgi:tetratricopeptide (TPR) repeat protein